MKVKNIQQVNFEAGISKQRYITDKMRYGIESLLIRMNHEIQTVKKDDIFISTITNKLIHENGAVFEDERFLKKALPHNEQMKGFSNLKFGSIILDIDNENGEIIDYKKPFFKPWFLVLRKAEEIINDFRVNFYNTSIVRKETLGMRELTQDGLKR